MSNKKKYLKETAASGSIGAHSVAVRFDSDEKKKTPMKKRGGSFLDFMQKHNSRVVNRLNMKKIKTPFNISLNENVSLDQIYSKLSGIQNQGRMSDDNTETYGVEDDEGNLMKITVRGDQQEEFETALAHQLADVEEYKMTGRGSHGKNVSMAEVLYNLKQDFDIVNVEFPEIPKDKVYNADKVSDPDEVSSDLPDPEANVGNADEMDSDEDLDDVDFGEDSPEGGEDFGGEEGEDGEVPGEGEEEEDVGMEFGGEEAEEESMLKAIIKMLAADAEAKRAQYEAEAEKSKALQAKYSMKAAQEEMHKQEDMMRMEQDVEQQKQKEKEAKKMADLAKFKLRGNVSESFRSFAEFISTHLFELDDLDTETTLRLQRRRAQQLKDPVEKRLRQQELNAARRLVQHRNNKDQEAADQEEQNQQNQQNPNQQNNPNARNQGGMGQ